MTLLTVRDASEILARFPGFHHPAGRVFGIKNSPDVTDYVAASTECHRLSRPEAEGVTEREMTW